MKTKWQMEQNKIRPKSRQSWKIFQILKRKSGLETTKTTPTELRRNETEIDRERDRERQKTNN